MSDFTVPLGPPRVLVSPPSAIRESLKIEVAKLLKDLPSDKGAMAEVSVDLERGINLVYAYRGQNGWEAGAWVGRHWDGPVVGGLHIRKVW